MFASSPQGARAARRARSFSQHNVPTSVWASEASKTGAAKTKKKEDATPTPAREGAPVKRAPRKAQVAETASSAKTGAAESACADSARENEGRKGDEARGAGGGAASVGAIRGSRTPVAAMTVPRAPMPPTLYGSQSSMSPADNISSASSGVGVRNPSRITLPPSSGTTGFGVADRLRVRSLAPSLALARAGLRSMPREGGYTSGESNSSSIAAKEGEKTATAGERARSTRRGKRLDGNSATNCLGSLRRGLGERRKEAEGKGGRGTPDSIISDCSGRGSAAGSIGGRSTGTNDSELSVDSGSSTSSTVQALSFAQRREALVAASIRIQGDVGAPTKPGAVTAAAAQAPPRLAQGGAGSAREGMLARPLATRTQQGESKTAVERGTVREVSDPAVTSPSVIPAQPETCVKQDQHQLPGASGLWSWQPRGVTKPPQANATPGDKSTPTVSVSSSADSLVASTTPPRQLSPVAATTGVLKAVASATALSSRSAVGSSSVAADVGGSDGAAHVTSEAEDGAPPGDLLPLLPYPAARKTIVRAKTTVVDDSRAVALNGSGRSSGWPGPIRRQQTMDAAVPVDSLTLDRPSYHGVDPGKDASDDESVFDDRLNRSVDDIPPAEMGALGVSLACALCGTAEAPVKSTIVCGRDAVGGVVVGGKRAGGGVEVEVAVEVKRCSRCRRGCCDACFKWLPVHCRGPKIVVPGVCMCVRACVRVLV